MKRILLLFATMLTVLQLMAGEPISLKDITNGAFATKRISGVNPLKGTSEYAQISSDCSYKRIQIVSIVVRLQQTFISMM